jgi:hypothetical protein
MRRPSGQIRDPGLSSASFRPGSHHAFCPYDVSPVDVDLFGIKVTVTGIDPKGRPVCRLQGRIAPQVMPFLVQNVQMRYRYLYY